MRNEGPKSAGGIEERQAAAERIESERGMEKKTLGGGPRGMERRGGAEHGWDGWWRSKQLRNGERGAEHG